MLITGTAMFYTVGGPAMAWIRTPVLAVASPALLMTELSRYPLTPVGVPAYP